jgi:hypothetical protein
MRILPRIFFLLLLADLLCAPVLAWQFSAIEKNAFMPADGGTHDFSWLGQIRQSFTLWFFLTFRTQGVFVWLPANLALTFPSVALCVIRPEKAMLLRAGIALLLLTLWLASWNILPLIVFGVLWRSSLATTLSFHQTLGLERSD